MTQILDAAAAGDAQATERLFPLVYDELRRMAGSLMAKERPGQTIQPTALVNEAYLKMVGPGDIRWQSRAHFFGAAASAMRRILIDRARHLQTCRAHQANVAQGIAANMAHASDLPSLDSGGGSSSTPQDLLELDQSLRALAQRDPRQHEVVMLRFFAGLTVEQTAQVMNVSPATVKNDWSFARAWLTADARRRTGGRAAD